MDEDDAVGVALLGVGRGDPQAQVQADRAQDHGRDRKPRHHPPRQRIKALRRGVFEPVDPFISHDKYSEPLNLP